jgi:hypothetical protein
MKRNLYIVSIGLCIACLAYLFYMMRTKTPVDVPVSSSTIQGLSVEQKKAVLKSLSEGSSTVPVLTEKQQLELLQSLKR